MKKFVALLLIAATLLTFAAACGAKDELAGTWSAEFEYDGTITWTFDGRGKCTLVDYFGELKGTYTIEGDQLTVKLESWSEPYTYTFPLDGNSLTMEENTGYGISGTFTKQ